MQLAMLGSILTNLLFVFGMSCLIGGMRWQVQEIRVISGNVSVGMLYLSAAGSLLPAALFLSGQLPNKALNDNVPSKEELVFCRVNAAVMVILYLCYLLFQLGTHKEEFDDKEQSASKENHPAQRNLWCQRHVMREIVGAQQYYVNVSDSNNTQRGMEKSHRSHSDFHRGHDGDSASSRSSLSETDLEGDFDVLRPGDTSSQQRRRRKKGKERKSGGGLDHMSPLGSPVETNGLKEPPKLRLATGHESFHSDRGMRRCIHLICLAFPFA